ncbi:MAG: acetyl-CoA carboxylase biotin carboxyl carrier protein [Oligoflexales bacterium]
MDLKKLEAIMKLMNKHAIHEVTLDDKEEGKWRLKANVGVFAAAPQQSYIQPMPTMLPQQPVPGFARSDDKSADLKLKANQKVVTSPFVGTFYSSPSPEAESFVKVGQRVKKGDVLCIVEAMKIMNEIESEFDGVIAEVLVQNAQPVEYEQPIFILE